MGFSHCPLVLILSVWFFTIPWSGSKTIPRERQKDKAPARTLQTSWCQTNFAPFCESPWKFLFGHRHFSFQFSWGLSVPQPTKGSFHYTLKLGNRKEGRKTRPCLARKYQLRVCYFLRSLDHLGDLSCVQNLTRTGKIRCLLSKLKF